MFLNLFCISVISADDDIEPILSKVAVPEDTDVKFFTSRSADSQHASYHAFAYSRESRPDRESIIIDCDTMPPEFPPHSENIIKVLMASSIDSLPKEAISASDRLWIVPVTDGKKRNEALIQSCYAQLLHDMKTEADAEKGYACFETLINSTPDLVWFKNVQGDHMMVNDAFCSTVNKTKKDIYKKSHYYIWDIPKEEYEQGNYVCLESEEIVMAAKKTVLFEETVKSKTGMKQFKTYKSPVLDRRGTVFGTCGIAHDVTDDLVRLHAEQYRASHDRLTCLLSKDTFFEQAEQKLAGAKEEYCIVCTDLMNFHIVNDLYGPKMGDTLLKSVAGRLRFFDGQETVCGRLADDRFAACVPWRRFSDPSFVKSLEDINHASLIPNYRVHLHVGVCRIEDRSVPVSVLCDRARMAIRTIKHSYADTVAYYNENMRSISIHAQQLTNEFAESLRKEYFYIVLQPQIDAEGRLLGAEALVRWNHPKQGIVPPGEFIPVLEESGLIYALDTFIWNAACARLVEWKRLGREDLYISVNISTRDFVYGDLYEDFTALVARYGLSPESLHLEITESAIIQEIGKVLPVVDRLRSAGFIVEMDDFGAAYSSLAALKDINIDKLKIDLKFLSHTANSRKSVTIIASVISMAHALGMETISEGVETEEHLELLKNAGCDVFQGYYFARPLDCAEFEKKYGFAG